MSKLKFNVLIDLEYNNKKIDTITPMDWCNGIDEIINEEFTPEIKDIDSSAKVMVETVMQNPEKISIEELLKKGNWESVEDVDNYLKELKENQKRLVEENEKLNNEKSSLIKNFKDIIWDVYIENPIREEILNQLDLIENGKYVKSTAPTIVSLNNKTVFDNNQVVMDETQLVNFNGDPITSKEE